MTELESLKTQWKSLILTQCNTRGCDNCPSNFNEKFSLTRIPCESTILQHKIMELEEVNES